MATAEVGIVVGGGIGEDRAAGESLLRSALSPFSVMFGEAAPPPLLLSAADTGMGFPAPAALRLPPPFSWFSFFAFISSAASALEMFSCFFHLVRRF